MRGARPRGTRKRKISPAIEKEAVKTALELLGRFIKNVSYWNEHGTDADSPKRELRHAIALIECVLGDEAADNIPGIEVARKAAIPIIRQARPPVGRKRGAHSLSWRDQLIIEAVEAVCRRHKLKPTRNPGSRDENHDPSSCSIVAEALRSFGIELGEKRITDKIWAKRTPTKL